MSSTATANAVQLYKQAFETFESCETASPWLTLLRRNALARFENLGFPTVRDEEWKYTDPTPAANLVAVQRPATEAPQVTLENLPLAQLPGHRLVWVDGHYREDLSTDPALLPEGVEGTCICRALANHSEVVQQHLGRYADSENEAFTALNTAFAADGAFLRVPAGVQVDQPINVIFVTTGHGEPVIHPRNLFLVGPGSSLTLVEAYVSVGDSPYFNNGVTEISVGQNAQVEHVKLQLEAAHAFHIGTQHLHVARDAVVASYSLNFGGRWVRNNSTAVMGDENAEITLNGLVVGQDDQHVDNHTTMDHAQPNCNSHEIYVHVLDGRSNGVFNGKIFVREDAQKTDAKQSNRSLLLSPEAQVNAKPQLEIFADDVKCTHGATIGQMDQEALFYLRARGVPEAQARHILVHAFAAQVWENLRYEELKEVLERELLKRLV